VVEGGNVTVQEARHRSVQIKAQEQVPRVGEHHDEGHQRTARAPDRDRAKVRPVNLTLFAGQGAQAQVRFPRQLRSVAAHQVAEVIRTARVTAFAHHAIQATRAQRREAREGVLDEGHERLYT